VAVSGGTSNVLPQAHLSDGAALAIPYSPDDTG